MIRAWHRFGICTLISHYGGKLTYSNDGIHLKCDTSGAITPQYVKELEEVLDETWQERAAIKQHDGNMSKEVAEAQAFEELKKELVK